MLFNNRPFPDLGTVFGDNLLLRDGDMFYGAHGNIFESARKLRKRETNAEKLLWSKLQRKQIDGFRFRRQHPLGPYIADFYCHEARIVIEVDGTIHNAPEQIERDEERSNHMASLGIRTLRFTNKEVENEIENVVQTIGAALNSSGGKSLFRGIQGV